MGFPYRDAEQAKAFVLEFIERLRGVDVIREGWQKLDMLIAIHIKQPDIDFWIDTRGGKLEMLPDKPDGEEEAALTLTADLFHKLYTGRATTHPEKSTAHAPDTRPNAHHPSTHPTHNSHSTPTPHTPTRSTPRSAPRCQNPSTASHPTQNRSSSNETPPPPPNAATTSTTTPPTAQATATRPRHPTPREPKTPSARATCPAWCACDVRAR
jgi:hypothetical protein